MLNTLQASVASGPFDGTIMMVYPHPGNVQSIERISHCRSQRMDGHLARVTGRYGQAALRQKSHKVLIPFAKVPVAYSKAVVESGSHP